MSVKQVKRSSLAPQLNEVSNQGKYPTMRVVERQDPYTYPNIVSAPPKKRIKGTY